MKITNALTSTLIHALLLQLLAVASSSGRADEARFFRLTGPVPVTITATSPAGIVSWTNEPTDATFTVSTAPALGGSLFLVLFPFMA